MPAKTPQIKLTPTPEFAAWFKAWRQESDLTESEAMDYLVSATAAQLGFTGQIMNKRGTYDRALAGIVKRADELTDYGRNDPSE